MTMDFSIGVPDGEAARSAVGLVHFLQSAGFTSYWAGGCVRDLLLGKTPIDYDIATSAVPDQIQHLFPRAELTGKSFGVCRVLFEGVFFEVATFRSDLAYMDGRHPEGIRFTDAPTDAQRRDFTINALFYDPIAKCLLDFVGGRADLDAGIIRAVGDPDARFKEDHLRILRALRFAARLDFTIEPATLRALMTDAHHLSRISPERIREELVRLFLEALRPGDAFRQLEATGVLMVVFPELARMRGQEQPPEFHPEGDVFTHTAVMLDRMARRSVRLIFAVLLHDVGKPPTAEYRDGRWRFENHARAGAELAREILARLRFSNDDIEAITHMVGNHMRFQNVSEMRRSTLRTLVGHPEFDDELELHRLDCESSHGLLDNLEFLQNFRLALQSEPALPPRWISGHDLLAMGLPSGPRMGQWLKTAYEKQLEGQFPDRESLLLWLRAAVVPIDNDSRS
jgi:poly(A) polymerase